VAAALVVTLLTLPPLRFTNRRFAVVQVTIAEPALIRAIPVAELEEVALTVRVLVRVF